MKRKNKNTEIIIMRLPLNIKEEFRKVCDDNLIGMSVRIRQLILKDIKDNKK